MPTGPVTLVTVDPRPTAVVAQTTTWEEFPTLWGQLLDEVYAVVRSSEELATVDDGTPKWQNVMLYKDGQPDVEVGVLAPRPFEAAGRVIPSQLPGGRTATAIHHGDYAQLGSTHDAVIRFVETRGLALAGPRWEIYGHWREDPDEVETEIHYLLR
jgi:effector-binding domain-containing protein